MPVLGTVHIPPDPRALSGLGRNHSLETALADLVDNSIDAGASHVLIRFMRQAGRLRGLYIVDNGKGMTSHNIDLAMTLGGRRNYEPDDLGSFGLGLKAASLGKAESVTVLSRAAGSMPVGRRLQAGERQDGFYCEVVAESFAKAELSRFWGIPTTGTGTIVRWDQVFAFPATNESVRVEEFITKSTTEILQHLGLVLHRIVSDSRIEILIDVEDVEDGLVGPPSRVEPINPFGYIRSGKSGYPKDLVAEKNGFKAIFRCHIWPPRSNLLEFKLPGGAEEHQGLYFYRRDRLLHAGGDWDGIGAIGRDRQLARVEVDIEGDANGFLTMNPEKSRVQVGPEFAQLAESAIAQDGSVFSDYLRDAEGRYSESRKRQRVRVSMAPPGKGFAPQLKRVIRDQIPMAMHQAPIDIRWTRFDRVAAADFFRVDRANRVLWLNERYRPAAKVGRRSSNDATLLKSLLYLLMEEAFTGDYLGIRSRDNLELWQEILTEAAKAGENE